MSINTHGRVAFLPLVHFKLKCPRPNNIPKNPQTLGEHPIIEHCYREFLLQSHDPDEREYPDPVDQIREVLIHSNYLSQKDIDICLAFDLAHIARQPEFENMRALHEALKKDYGSDDGYGTR